MDRDADANGVRERGPASRSAAGTCPCTARPFVTTLASVTDPAGLVRLSRVMRIRYATFFQGRYTSGSPAAVRPLEWILG
jgi:hypothetical protein